MPVEQLTLSDQLVASAPPPHDENASVTLSETDEENRERWRAVVDRPLIEWGRDPERFRDEEEGIEPPSAEIVRMASLAALALSQTPVPPPLRVAMNGEGGLTFEWRDDLWFLTLDITADGHAEFCRYEDCRLIDRRRLL